MPARKRSNWRHPVIYDEELAPTSRRTTRARREAGTSTTSSRRGKSENAVNISSSRKRPKSWVEVRRPPAPGIRFLVPVWIPEEELTQIEREKYLPKPKVVDESIILDTDGVVPPALKAPPPTTEVASQPVQSQPVPAAAAQSSVPPTQPATASAAADSGIMPMEIDPQPASTDASKTAAAQTPPTEAPTTAATQTPPTEAPKTAATLPAAPTTATQTTVPSAQSTGVKQSEGTQPLDATTAASETGPLTTPSTVEPTPQASSEQSNELKAVAPSATVDFPTPQASSEQSNASKAVAPETNTLETQPGQTEDTKVGDPPATGNEPAQTEEAKVGDPPTIGNESTTNNPAAATDTAQTEQPATTTAALATTTTTTTSDATTTPAPEAAHVPDAAAAPTGATSEAKASENTSVAQTQNTPVKDIEMEDSGKLGPTTTATSTVKEGTPQPGSAPTEPKGTENENASRNDDSDKMMISPEKRNNDNMMISPEKDNNDTKHDTDKKTTESETAASRDEQQK